MSIIIKSIRIQFDKYFGETEKAYHIKFLGHEHWLPKSCCSRFILNSKMGGNVAVSKFIYERITGEDVTDAESISYGKIEYFIEKHIPERIEPVKTEPKTDLLR